MPCLCQSPKQVTLHSVIIGSESGGCQENALGRLKILTLSKLSLPLCGRKSSPVSGGFVSRFKVCGGVHVSYIPLRR